VKITRTYRTSKGDDDDEDDDEDDATEEIPIDSSISDINFGGDIKVQDII
jgi:hypothetical protein